MSESKPRILLVDDDTSLLKLLAMRLNAAGYLTTAAESGAEALGLLEVARPQLVITDLQMDGMDGMTLFTAIHQDHPALPVIILTAHGSIPDAVAATRRGVFGFLTKPFDSRDLLEQVEKAMLVSGANHQPGKHASDAWRSEFITQSPIIEELLSQARLVAQSDSSILIHGASGTGKEVLARAIHTASPRNEQPFIAVNCGAIPESLLESELFGHTRGAFTGATDNYPGLFQAANHGTLFLDEAGDMPLSLQVKLLRVLQERTVRSVGSTSSVQVDVRIISATHRNLEEAIEAGTFREDLYYRLNVVSLTLPSLEARREDIPLLASHFLKQVAQRGHSPVTGLSPEAMEVLVSASWPGNIRQLLNVIEQATVLCTSAIVSAELIRKAIRDRSDEVLPFADAKRRFEQSYLVKILKITNGNVAQAARLAKRNRTEFYKLIQRHQLDPSDFRPH